MMHIREKGQHEARVQSRLTTDEGAHLSLGLVQGFVRVHPLIRLVPFMITKHCDLSPAKTSKRFSCQGTNIYWPCQSFLKELQAT